VPKTGEARLFSVESIIQRLTDSSNVKIGSYIDLPEKAIKWLIKEAQMIIKDESTLIELEGPVKVTGDFHG
jgi:hypothetical protein